MSGSLIDTEIKDEAGLDNAVINVKDPKEVVVIIREFRHDLFKKQN